MDFLYMFVPFLLAGFGTMAFSISLALWVIALCQGYRVFKEVRR